MTNVSFIKDAEIIY